MSDSRYHDHQELVRSVLVFLHDNFKGRWWESATGAVESKSGRFIRFGLVGSTDIIGFTCEGRATFFEIKTKSGKLSADQKKFERIALDNNCIHAVLREDFKDHIYELGLVMR